MSLRTGSIPLVAEALGLHRQSAATVEPPKTTREVARTAE
jgi:hypothetical protein